MGHYPSEIVGFKEAIRKELVSLGVISQEEADRAAQAATEQATEQSTNATPDGAHSQPAPGKP